MGERFVLGYFLVNDMQTPPTPQNEAFLIFGPKWRATFWNEWKINLPIFAILIFWKKIFFLYYEANFRWVHNQKENCPHDHIPRESQEYVIVGTVFLLIMNLTS